MRTRSIAAVALPALALGVLLACSTEPEAPLLSRQELLDPVTCARCHEQHYREWSGSMHAYAAQDPLFVAMNRRGQRETRGELGALCVGCHAPMAVREGATKDGLNLDAVPAALKGVTCFYCHSVDRVEGDHNNPLRLATDGALRGELADPAPNSAHRSSYSALHDRDRAESSSLCGACHDIVTGHGAALERTFQEWRASVFSGPGGATCAQCHMDQSDALVPVAQAPGAPLRRAHSHALPGVDLALTPGFPEAATQREAVQRALDRTLQSALCVVQTGDTFSLRVIVDNVGAGHAFPSGSGQDRRLFAEVVATQGGATVFQSGVVPEGGDVIAAADPDLWLLRDCIFGPDGREVHMFWEAASFESNALPARATFDPRDPRYAAAHVVQAFPRRGAAPGVPDRVTLKLRLVPVGLDVLSDLVASGDLDPSTAKAMPTLQVGKTLEWTPAAATKRYTEDRVPVLCVSATNLDVAADKVPAPSRARCSP